MWSFVVKKVKQHWVWLAICRKTRQVVAYVIGDRSAATCRELWRAIPKAYRTGTCYTDFWNAYTAVIPDDQHEAVGKETGETAHIERFNNTILATAGPVRPQDLIVLKIVDHARNLLTPVLMALQYGNTVQMDGCHAGSVNRFWA
jgi:insertion element IS1 protein InsB